MVVELGTTVVVSDVREVTVCEVVTRGSSLVVVMTGSSFISCCVRKVWDALGATDAFFNTASVISAARTAVGVGFAANKTETATAKAAVLFQLFLVLLMFFSSLIFFLPIDDQNHYTRSDDNANQNQRQCNRHFIFLRFCFFFGCFIRAYACRGCCLRFCL